MTPYLNTLLIGILCLVGCLALAGREILMGPDSPNYPPGPWWIRMLMAAWATGLLVRGSDILFSLGTPTPQEFPPAALLATVLQAAGLTGSFIYILRQRLPASFYARMARAYHLTHCGANRTQGEAMAELSLSGFRVAAPGEHPDDAFVEPHTLQ